MLLLCDRCSVLGASQPVKPLTGRPRPAGACQATSGCHGVTSTFQTVELNLQRPNGAKFSSVLHRQRETSDTLKTTVKAMKTEIITNKGNNLLHLRHHYLYSSTLLKKMSSRRFVARRARESIYMNVQYIYTHKSTHAYVQRGGCASAGGAVVFQTEDQWFYTHTHLYFAFLTS